MFETILLAVDGSKPSDRAVEVAEQLALKAGSEVVVMHVRERFVNALGFIEAETPDEAYELVESVVLRIKDAGVSARAEIESAIHGYVPREILQMADATGTSCIVMGSRGLSDFAGLVMGSVAHKVLHLARCPVMVVR
jgi:nucleotide-binding universal stress UspA family protein